MLTSVSLEREQSCPFLPAERINQQTRPEQADLSVRHVQAGASTHCDTDSDLNHSKADRQALRVSLAVFGRVRHGQTARGGNTGLPIQL